MEVSKRAAVWLRRRLPQGFEPIDVIPRAYCAAKPAPLCAVFVTPPDDYRTHLTKNEHIRACNAGQTIHEGISAASVGDWMTLCYATCRSGGWWYAVPLIPLKFLLQPASGG